MSSESSGSNPNKVHLDFGSECSANNTLSSQELATTEANLGLHNDWPIKFEFPLDEFKTKFINKLKNHDRAISNFNQYV